MKLLHLIAAAVAVTGLSLPVLSASAGPVPQDTEALKGQTESSVTLAGHHHSGGGGGFSGGGWRPGGSFAGPRFNASPRFNAAPRFNSGVRSYSVPNSYSGAQHYRHYNGTPGGARWRHDGDRHRRGYWRHGHWYYGYSGYYGSDGSCYPECRAAGYSPAYCYANAWSFCY